MDDLENDLKLEITDYSKLPELNDAITRYYTLLRMTFETNIFKVFETPGSQIYRFSGIEAAKGIGPKQDVDLAEIKVPCSKCKAEIGVQANFKKGIPIKDGTLPYPTSGDVVICPNCGTQMNLANIRLQLEAQSGKKVVRE